MKKTMKKPAFMVMGSTLAFFTFASPMMAHNLSNSLKDIDTSKANSANVKTLPNAQIKSSTYIKDQDKMETKDQDKEKTGKGSASTTVSAAAISDVSHTSKSGKGTISFTVAQDTSSADLEFTCYKITGNVKTVFSKIKGNYSAGKHSVDLDLPDNTDQCDLVISSQNADSSTNVLWSREAGGSWKAWKKGEVSNWATIVSQKLMVTCTLIDKDSKTWSYKVKNPNSKSVTFNWMLEGTTQSGQKTIGAGDEITLTSIQGGTQNLLVNVPGEQGYDIKVAAMESPGNSSAVSSNSTSSDNTGPSNSSSGSSGTMSIVTSPSTTPDSGSTSSSSGGTSPTGDTSNGSALGSVGSSPTNTSPSSNTMGTAGTSTGAVSNASLPSEQIPASSITATPQTGVADVSRINSPETTTGTMNLSAPAGISQLPQTGEKAPYGLYAIGALLTLVGSFFLRKKGARS
jgi:LPXTG-motif cell wall-anchored protein